MLGVDAPGIEALREQASVAEVVGQCECGCATIYLGVDRSSAPQSEIREYAAIDASTPFSEDELDEFFELIVFVRDGWLDSLEIVYYGEEPPTTFPPPASFLPPRAR
jgi:hypothetical protein